MILLANIVNVRRRRKLKTPLVCIYFLFNKTYISMVFPIILKHKYAFHHIQEYGLDYDIFMDNYFTISFYIILNNKLI